MTHDDHDPGLDAALERVRQGIAAHHAGVEPDAGFSARVLQRLPRRSSAGSADATEVLRWATLRLLPWAAALALVAVLLAVTAPPLLSADALLVASSEETLAGFLVSGSGGAP